MELYEYKIFVPVTSTESRELRKEADSCDYSVPSVKSYLTPITL